MHLRVLAAVSHTFRAKVFSEAHVKMFKHILNMTQELRVMIVTLK